MIGNAMKQHMEGVAGRIGQARIGIVQSIDPLKANVRVLMQPEGVLSGWLPVMSMMIGTGWGVLSLPLPGDQVVIIADNGYGDHGIVIGALYSDQQTPPTALPGEVLIKHQTGANIHITAAGQISLTDASGTSVTLNDTGNVMISGNLIVSGNISDAAGAHGTLAAFRTAYNQHKHTNVSTGTASSGLSDHITS